MVAATGGAMDPAELDRLRAALADQLMADGYLGDKSVEAAFRAVPRHMFVPHVTPVRAYRNDAIKISDTSSSSQPSIMAAMLEQLALEPGMRVLEIGAGSGYNAALMANIAGSGGHVVTVDISPDLVDTAREYLSAAEVTGVEVVCGDGARGYESGAPYDRVILTVGARDIAPAWRDQLAPGGTLVLPLALRSGVQKAVAFTKCQDLLKSTSVIDCGFMMLQGPSAGSESVVQLGSVPSLSLSVDEATSIDPNAWYELLRGPHVDVRTGILVSISEVWRSLSMWLALRRPDFCSLSAWGDAVDEQIVPPLLTQSGEWKSAHTVGLIGQGEVCVLAEPMTEQSDGSSICGNNNQFELRVRQYGHGGEPATRLVADIEAWDQFGRPGAEKLRITAHPPTADPAVSGTDVVLRKRSSTLVASWHGLDRAGADPNDRH